MGDADNRSYHEVNVKLRNQYTQVQEQLSHAEENGNDSAIESLRSTLDRIGQEFYENNRGLAASVAKNFLAQSPSNGDDYLSAAALGLWEAFCKWDPSQETTFGTFSRNYIKGMVSRTVRRYEFYHMGQGDFNRRLEVRSASEKLATDLGRTPSYAEIADKLEVSLGVVERGMGNAPASLDRIVGDSGWATLGDLVTACDVDGEDHLWTSLEHEVSEDILDELNDLQLWIALARRKLLGHEDDVSIMDIADTIGRGRESVRRASECADLRILAGSFAHREGRNPTWKELMRLSGRSISPDKEKSLKSMYQPSCWDVQQRWKRASLAASKAGAARDKLARARAIQRLDRIGEEALTQHADLVKSIAERYVSREKPHRRIPLAAVAHLVWSSILTWKESYGTLASYVNARAARRWQPVQGAKTLSGSRRPTSWWAHIRTRLDVYKK